MQVIDVTKKYSRKQVLSSVSFQVENGCVALLGPNGAGKTTLISCIAGLISVSSGSIEFDHQANCSSVGYLPQQFTFLPHLTVRESLQYLGRLSAIPEGKIPIEVDAAIASTNLSTYETTLVKALSGGTIRRLGIAQSLLGDPELLLLDEPTVGLDIEERGKLKTILARLKASRTMIISTHLVEDIVGLCDKVLVLSNGKLLFDGLPTDLMAFARGHVCISSDDSPTANGGVPSSTSFSAKEYQSRFVMPESRPEYDVAPTLEEGYLALLHGFVGEI